MQRQRYSNEFKLQVVKEVQEVGNKSAVARRYEITPNMVRQWEKHYQDGQLANADPNGVSTREIGELTKENDHLKQLLGDKDLEIAVLRDLIKKKSPHLLKKLK